MLGDCSFKGSAAPVVGELASWRSLDRSERAEADTYVIPRDHAIFRVEAGGG